jgi:hypothetical protein
MKLLRRLWRFLMKRWEDLKPAGRIKRERRLEAVKAFEKSLNEETPPAPEGETECERRVRILANIHRRFELEERANLRHNYKMRMYWLKQEVEQKLIIARRELRFERGDY